VQSNGHRKYWITRGNATDGGWWRLPYGQADTEDAGRPGSGLSGPNRRDFLCGLSVGALIVGFDPVSRRWVTGSEARAPVIRVPPLKGRLLFSDAALSADADDFGHIVHNHP
jgi:hypothetical protein